MIFILKTIAALILISNVGCVLAQSFIQLNCAGSIALNASFDLNKKTKGKARKMHVMLAYAVRMQTADSLTI